MQRLDTWRSRFFWKIYLSYAALLLIVLIGLGSMGYMKIKVALSDQIERSLNDSLVLLTPQATRWLEHPHQVKEKIIRELGRASQNRITLIRADGQLLFDSHTTSQAKENFLHQKEFSMALAHGISRVERKSRSMGLDMIYHAMAIKKDSETLGVLRLGAPVSRSMADLEQIKTLIIGGAMIALIGALVMGLWLTRRVTAPILEIRAVCNAMMEGHYRVRVTRMPKDEIGLLAKTLNALGKDITRKIETIDRDKIQLRKLERIRRDFVANVSHEIKTPLTAIKGYSETLLSTPLTDPELNRRFLDKILKNSQRLTALVSDILSLAHLESPSMQLEPVPVDWVPLAKQVVSLYDDAIKSKKLHLQLNLPERAIVYGNEAFMVQIIENLLTNAIRYTPEGGAIELALSKDKRDITLKVKDNGIGISPEDQGRIFERFYRVDKARSRELGGTGLGLAIVKHLVSALGGDIEVDSKPDQGSLFSVRLKALST